MLMVISLVASIRSTGRMITNRTRHLLLSTTWRKGMLSAVAALAVQLPLGVFAETGNSDLSRLLAAKLLRCTFSTGVEAVFDSTQPRVQQFTVDPKPRPGPSGTPI